MTWTNRNDLPDTLVKAVMLDTHRMAAGGTISVTTLFSAPQIRYLKACFDYEQDVMDGMWALLGTAVHHILERANIESERQRAFILTIDYLERIAKDLVSSNPAGAQKINNGAKWLLSLIPQLFPETQQRYIFEKSLTLDMGDHVISGTFDLYDRETGTLWDYKVCTTYQWTNPTNRIKWDRQLNTYAYMIRKEMGLPVNHIRVCAIFRDWLPSGVTGQRDYPDNQIKSMFIPLYDEEQTWELINYHLNRHREADKGFVPICTGEERWAKADTWAVMKQGGRNALKLFDDEIGALEFIKINAHKHPIGLYAQHRPGESVYCGKYCPVSHVCRQYEQEIKKRESIKK